MARIIGFEALSELAPAGIGATYATLATLTFHAKQLLFVNSLDGDVVLSFDGGTTDHVRLPASTSLSLNFTDNEHLLAGTVIQVKDGASAPTAGTLGVTPVYHK